MLNDVIIMGRLVADPELRRTESGIAVTSFRIACDRDYQAKDASEKQADFVDIVAWRNTAEFVSNYFSKGRMIIVAGRLQIRNYTDKDGNKRYAAEVVANSCYFGDSKSSTGPAQAAKQEAPAAAPQAGEFAQLDDDGELPF